MSSTISLICFIDIGRLWHDLTEEDGAFTFGLNFCLGFADGGQYVRSTTATGGSTPAFETEEAWLADAAAYWGAAK
mgnify:CR=1 FL=1